MVRLSSPMEFSSGGKERAPQFSSLEEDVRQEVSRQKRQEEWDKARDSEIEGSSNFSLHVAGKV